MGNNLRLASSANETGRVNDSRVWPFWAGDAAGVPNLWNLDRAVNA
jgi:hypothetical protein